MKFNKITPGTPAGQMPSFSASWQNAVSESAQAYQEQKRLGETGNGSKALRDTEHRVKCYNNTANPFLRGQSLQLDGYRMTEVKPRHRWFNGTDYDGTDKWGVVLRDMDDTGVSEVQMGGICTARVNVTSLSHSYAEPSGSSRNFSSTASTGPLEFLSTPGSTGVQDVVVRFTSEGDPIADMLRGTVASVVAAGAGSNTYRIFVLKTSSPAPLPLPTGTPAITGTVYVADVQNKGANIKANDVILAIRNVGCDSYNPGGGAVDVNWEYIPIPVGGTPFTCIITSSLTAATWDDANKRLTPASNTDKAVLLGWDAANSRYDEATDGTSISPEWPSSVAVTINTDKALIGRGIHFEGRYLLYEIDCPTTGEITYE